MLHIEQRDQYKNKYQLFRIIIDRAHKNNKLLYFITHDIVMTVRNNHDKQLE